MASLPSFGKRCCNFVSLYYGYHKNKMQDMNDDATMLGKDICFEKMALLGTRFCLPLIQPDLNDVQTN